MAKYAVVVDSIRVNANDFEKFGPIGLTESAQNKLALFDEFDVAVPDFLEKWSELFYGFIPLECLAIPRVIHDGDVEVDTNDIETINNIVETLSEMSQNKKVHNIDVHSMSYIFNVSSGKVYFDIVFDDELLYGQTSGDNSFYTIHTNIFKMDNPKKEYFFEVSTIINEKFVGEKGVCSFRSVRLIPIDE